MPIDEIKCSAAWQPLVQNSYHFMRMFFFLLWDICVLELPRLQQLSQKIIVINISDVMPSWLLLQGREVIFLSSRIHKGIKFGVTHPFESSYEGLISWDIDSIQGRILFRKKDVPGQIHSWNISALVCFHAREEWNSHWF